MELLRSNATVVILMTMEERCNEFIRKICDSVDDDVNRQVEDIRELPKNGTIVKAKLIVSWRTSM